MLKSQETKKTKKVQSLPALLSLITFQFHSLVVFAFQTCMPVVIWHLKG